MKRFCLSQFWRKPKQATICLFDTKDRLICEKKVKLHTCKESPDFVEIRDRVRYGEKDLGAVTLKSMKLFYEGELVSMRRIPEVSFALSDSLEVTWTLEMENCPKLNLQKIK